jgi:DNA methylase
MALVGVTQLAAALGRSKGTISKHADAGKIPVAERDARGNPLFDVDQVRAVYEQGINPRMRRQGAPVHGTMPAPELEDDDELEQPERRSPGPRPSNAGTGGSGLQQQLVMERRLRNRRLEGEGAASWFTVKIRGRELRPSEQVRWKTNEQGMQRLLHADRLEPGKNNLNYVRFIDDYPAMPIRNVWTDVGSSLGGEKFFVVQTSARIVERCILMATDPGDLVLDLTCGSGTTATVAEQWGRRWITIDTSRVALALARARIMGARYPFYLLRREANTAFLVRSLALSSVPISSRRRARRALMC